MPEYEQQLKIAETVLKSIKEQTVCSNDIISRVQMPWLTLAMIPNEIEKHGQQKIETYQRYTQYLEFLRSLVRDYAGARRMSCAVSSSAIAMTHFGVGECQELSTLAIQKLVALGKRDVAFVVISGKMNRLKDHPFPFMHAFVLIGIDEKFSLKNGSDISELSALSDQIVVLDPLLNHVGRARDFRAMHAGYFDIFSFNQVCAIDVVGQPHFDNRLRVEENVRQLIAYVESKNISTFDRAFCDLPLISNPSLQKESCHETTLLRGLNTNSGLFFSGVRDERCYVDAVTEIHSDEENEKAKVIQTSLRTGCFYTGASQRFFVIHHINVGRNSEDLPRRISNTYC